mgnify:CR=1 FL=1
MDEKTKLALAMKYDLSSGCTIDYQGRHYHGKSIGEAFERLNRDLRRKRRKRRNLETLTGLGVLAVIALLSLLLA